MTDPDRLSFSPSFNRYCTGHLQFANTVRVPGNPEGTETDKSPALMRFLHTEEHGEFFAMTSTKHAQIGDNLLCFCLGRVLHSSISFKGICFVITKKGVIFLKMKTMNKESTQGKKTTAGNSGR